MGVRGLAETRANSMSLVQRIFSFPAMLGALLVGGVATIARTFFVDPDVWWHIKSGQVILATHHWPTTDPYSYSVAGQHWIAFEWVGEVLLATMYRLGGMRGLEALLFILGSAIRDRALCTGGYSLRQFEGCFRRHGRSVCSGYRTFQSSSTDAGLSVSGHHPHRFGAVPAG